MAQRRKIARICALFKAFTGERSWKSVRNMLKGPCYLSRDDHDLKIRARKQRTEYINELIIETENAIRRLEPKRQNMYRLQATARIKQINKTINKTH